MLKTIRLCNFKSITNKPVLLNNLNVLIGANAAGKSNFVDALRFIHDVLNNGLASSIERRFGWENVLTREKDKSNKIKVEILYDLKDTNQEIKIEKRSYKPLEQKYIFESSYKNKKYYLESESLEGLYIHNKNRITEKFVRSRSEVKIIESITDSHGPRNIDVPPQLRDKLFIQSGFFCFGAFILSQSIQDWRFYDLDVNAASRPCIDESQNILLDDGHNFASILERLTRAASRRTRERILKIMSILVPGFNDWKTIRQFDGSLSFMIFEKGITKPLLPKMVSDGTIRLLSLLLALLYQPSPVALICIDEPERYLHPQVFKPLVEIMRDVSKNTQLIVTTHSTELVKWLKPSEVLMVDKIDNVTNIMRAQDVSMIDEFIKEFSLDELWLGGYLKGGKII